MFYFKMYQLKVCEGIKKIENKIYFSVFKIFIGCFKDFFE